MTESDQSPKCNHRWGCPKHGNGRCDSYDDERAALASVQAKLIAAGLSPVNLSPDYAALQTENGMLKAENKELKTDVSVCRGANESFRRIKDRLESENEVLKLKLSNAESALRNLDEAFCSDDYSSKEHRELARNALIAARAIYSKN